MTKVDLNNEMVALDIDSLEQVNGGTLCRNDIIIGLTEQMLRVRLYDKKSMSEANREAFLEERPLEGKIQKMID